MSSLGMETIEGESSQKERTLEIRNKGKEGAEQNPSSSSGRPSVEQVPRWLQKEIIINNKKKFNANEEDMIELIEVLRKPKSP